MKSAYIIYQYYIGVTLIKQKDYKNKEKVI